MLHPSNLARAVFQFSVTLVMLAIVMPVAFAQTGRGTVSGTVRDPGEAAVSSEQVTMTQTQTGIAQKSQTSSAGFYYFGARPTGPYKVTFEKSCFEPGWGTLTLAVG